MYTLEVSILEPRHVSVAGGINTGSSLVFRSPSSDDSDASQIGVPQIESLDPH